MRLLKYLLVLFCLSFPQPGKSDTTLLFHWAPKDQIGLKLDLGKFNFQGPHYEKLSDGRSSAWDLGNWLDWARTRFYDQQPINPYDGRSAQFGFTDGVGLYASEDFLEYFRGKNNYAEDLLIIEVSFPSGQNPLDLAPRPTLAPFYNAKRDPSLRLGMEERLPLMARNPEKQSVVIYRIPDHRDGGVQISYRPPTSSDVRKIWEMNSGSPEQAFRFLRQLAEIKLPFNPAFGGGVMMWEKTQNVRVVFDRLYFDEGYSYLIKFLSKLENPINMNSFDRESMHKIINSYEKNLNVDDPKRIELLEKADFKMAACAESMDGLRR